MSTDPSERMICLLERNGLVERDVEENFLTLDGKEDGLMHHLQGSSITKYRK